MLQTMIVKEKIKLKEPMLPSYMLTNDELALILNNWMKLLNDHHIHIVFNQTPVNTREQYDYLANEFMYLELPPHPKGLHFCFMYDRVPSGVPSCEIDHMTQQLLEDVFRKKQHTAFPYFNRRLHFNEHENLSEPEFNYLLTHHPKNRSDIQYCRIDFGGKETNNECMDISGSYLLGYTLADHSDLLHGKWKVSLRNQDGNWTVYALFIDGF